MAGSTLPNCDLGPILGGPNVFDRQPATPGLGVLLDALKPFVPGVSVPYATSTQPMDKSQAQSAPNFKLNFPGGTTFELPPNAQATNMLHMLEPLLTSISMALMIMGPIKIIIDIIIAIINVLCALPNPFKVVEAMIALMLAVIPLLSLLPPAAGLLLLLDLIKATLAILASILLELMPRIDLLIENAAKIQQEVANGNLAAARASAQKVCDLVKNMLNSLAILAPINSILQLIFALAGLATKGICGPGSGNQEGAACCETCPALLRTPPYTSSATFDTNIITGNVENIYLSNLLYGSDNGSPLSGITPHTLWPRNLYTRMAGGLESADFGHYLSDINLLIQKNADTLIVGITYLPAGLANIPQNRVTAASKLASALPDSITGTTVIKLTEALNISGTILRVVFVADENAAYSSDILNIGCMSSVANARNQMGNASGGNDGQPQGTAPSDPLEDQLGLDGVPQIDIKGITDTLNNFLNDPIGKSGTVLTDFASAIEKEIENFSELGSKVVCLIADPVQSSLTVSSLSADISQSVGIKFTIRDRSGQNVLAGIPSSVAMNAVFTTTLGTLSPTTFDIDTGTFEATLTSPGIGIAEINAYFVTTDVCMVPKAGYDPTLPPLSVQVQFLSSSLRPRRQDRQYVQSLGGRRR